MTKDAGLEGTPKQYLHIGGNFTGWKPWYSYPLRMEGKATGNLRKIPKVVDHHCPHCGSNSASLQPDYPADPKHLYCFVCGYEYAFYFKPQVDKWINWIEMTERRNGFTPVLLSDAEQRARDHWAERVRRYASTHHEERKAYRKVMYRRANPEIKKRNFAGKTIDERIAARKEYRRKYDRENRERNRLRQIDYRKKQKERKEAMANV